MAINVTLLEAVCRKEYVIDKVETGDERMEAFLFSLGCYSGEPITVIRHLKGGIIVGIKNGRYSIDKRLGNTISVIDA